MADSQGYIWRVNRTPRFPILSLGEYMVADDGPRETIRRNMKYERISPTIIYRKLQRAIAGFVASPTRDRRILERCRDELTLDRENASSPRAADNASYALRALDVFERSLNAFPMGGVNFSLAPIYKPHVIEGVKVSIQPTALMSVTRPRGKDLKGAVIIDAAKGIEAKTDESRRKATDAMIHSSYLLHEHIATLNCSDDERSSTEHCMIFHTHRQELVKSPTNYKKLLRNVEAACRDIASAWDSISPPSSFDHSAARYRN